MPTGECATGGARFAADASPDLELVVSMAFPVAAMLDLDCDGTKNEWTGICPPPSAVRASCREALTDPVMCGACEPTLWPVGADFATCVASGYGDEVCRPKYDSCIAQ